MLLLDLTLMMLLAPEILCLDLPDEQAIRLIKNILLLQKCDCLMEIVSWYQREESSLVENLKKRVAVLKYRPMVSAQKYESI